MECLSREEWLIDPIQTLTFQRGGDVVLKKTADMPPTYPDASRLALEQGVVSIEATVSRTGCVQAAVVVNGVTPHLDAAAILAVSQWQFTPPTLDGAQIPLAFTASVEFTLR
jgi:TonB family protein